MKTAFKGCIVVTLLLLVCSTVLAQGVTSTLTGSVTTEGKALPGVTVTVSSRSLQGTRTTVTGESGGYSFAALPPGDYEVTFELAGLQPATKRVSLNLAQTSRADVDLKLSAITEAITVTASSPAALETFEISSNFQAENIENLPTLRTLRATTLLAPGVTDAGPNKNITISGAQAFDSLFLVNGVVVNENLRGQPHNLFIEDAIQETTVLTGGVSAEYGRFTGGVVSTITKSGGNEFSGSFRDSFTNDVWKEKTDFVDPVRGTPEPDHSDRVNNVYEATLGGRVIRDRLWFFGAGRKEKSSTTLSTVATNIPFVQGREETRWEGKLTGMVTTKHSVVGSYLDVDFTITNNRFGNIVDLRSLYDQGQPNKLTSLHYNGILTNNLLIEGQYSAMDFSFIGGGALTHDLIEGTLLRDTATSRRFWSPTFCGICRDKERNNKSTLAKATYFLSTKSTGNHNIVGGWEDFHQLRTEDNYQSGSNFRLWGDFIYAGDQVYLHANPTNGRIAYHPLLGESQESDFAVTSLFLNDKWDLNSNFSFNLGVRYDKAEGKNQAGVSTVDDSAVSPRLGANWDLRGDGKHRFNVSYSKYVSKVDQGPADSTSTGGRYASYYWDYRGPEINAPGTPTSALVPTAEVIRQMFAWFSTVGGVSNTNLINYVSIPGATTRIGENLTAPSMSEYTVGYGTAIGAKGFARGDYIYRQWNDFYIIRRDLTTGIFQAATGPVDQGVIETDDTGLERDYSAIQTQASYRFTDRFTIGGNYTYSKLQGNVEGETFNNATVFAETEKLFPEYTAFDQNHPVGYLNSDMRHRGTAWVQYDLPTRIGNFNFSLLERYHSGLPYSAVADSLAGGGVDVRFNATTNPNGVRNPGYITPPSRVTYYFSDRGEFRLDDITATDLGINYALPLWRSVNVFFQGDVINVLNEQGVEYAATNLGPVINQTVRVRRNGATFPSGRPAQAFNPFTTTPIEGVHFEKDVNFGKPTNKDAYQDPLEYRFSVGLKF